MKKSVVYWSCWVKTYQNSNRICFGVLLRSDADKASA